MFAAAVVVLLSAAPASAHDELVGTVPAPGATVSAPGRVRLTFGEDVADVGSRVVVAGPKGPVAGRLGATGPNLVESFPTPLGPGRYTVTWRAVSADGHPVSGRFQFSVRAGAGAIATRPGSPGTLTARATISSAPGQPTVAESSAGDGSRPLMLGAGLGLAGLALAVATIRLTRRRPDPS